MKNDNKNKLVQNDKIDKEKPRKYMTKKQTKAKMNKIFEILDANGHHVVQACEAVGASRTYFYELVSTVPKFKKRDLKSRALGLEEAEQELKNRALDGVEKAIIYQGEQTGTYMEKTPEYLFFHLRGLDPQKWGNKVYNTNEDTLTILSTEKIAEEAESRLNAFREKRKKKKRNDVP